MESDFVIKSEPQWQEEEEVEVDASAVMHDVDPLAMDFGDESLAGVKVEPPDETSTEGVDSGNDCSPCPSEDDDCSCEAAVPTKKKKGEYSFETNPAIRKRQHRRLLCKLRHTAREFATRVGEQVVVVVVNPSGKHADTIKVFGSKPLEDIVNNIRTMIVEQLETASAAKPAAPPDRDLLLWELAPLLSIKQTPADMNAS